MDVHRHVIVTVIVHVVTHVMIPVAVIVMVVQVAGMFVVDVLQRAVPSVQHRAEVFVLDVEIVAVAHVQLDAQVVITVLVAMVPVRLDVKRIAILVARVVVEDALTVREGVKPNASIAA